MTDTTPRWEWTGYDYQVAFVNDRDGYLYKGDYRIKVEDLDKLPKNK